MSKKEKASNKVQTQEFLVMLQKIDSCSYGDVNDFESQLKTDNDGGTAQLLMRKLLYSV